MTPISIFDVDRTITRRPTYSLFLLHAMLRTAPWRLALVPLLVLVGAAYAAKRVSRERMKEAMHRVALGGRMPRAKAERLATTFVDSLMKKGLYAEAWQLMAAERRAGRRIMLATAAPSLYIAPLAERLQVKDVIATAGSWDGDWLSHRINGKNCYGASKLEMIEQSFEELGIDRAETHVRFYTDHASDLPVCEWADEAIAVNPSLNMAIIARAHGWSIIDWRKL